MSQQTNGIEWAAMAQRGGLVLAAALTAALMLHAGGCEGVGDGVAWMIGAPTSADREKAAADLQAADEKVADAEERIAALERVVEEAEQKAARLDEQRASMKRLYAETAAKLAEADDDTAAVLMVTLADIQRQIEQVDESRDQVAEAIATARERLASHQEATDSAHEEVERLLAQIDGFEQQTAQAIDRAVGTVRQVGKTANELGVVGAEGIGNQVADNLSTWLAMLLGGTTIGGTVLARRRTKERDETEHEKRAEKKRADELEEVVVVTEEMGLIKDDSSAETRKAKNLAKAKLSPEAYARLQGVTQPISVKANAAAA